MDTVHLGFTLEFRLHHLRLSALSCLQLADVSGVFRRQRWAVSSSRLAWVEWQNLLFSKTKKTFKNHKMGF